MPPRTDRRLAALACCAGLATFSPLHAQDAPLANAPAQADAEPVAATTAAALTPAQRAKAFEQWMRTTDPEAVMQGIQAKAGELLEGVDFASLSAREIEPLLMLLASSREQAAVATQRLDSLRDDETLDGLIAMTTASVLRAIASQQRVDAQTLGAMLDHPQLPAAIENGHMLTPFVALSVSDPTALQNRARAIAGLADHLPAEPVSADQATAVGQYWQVVTGVLPESERELAESVRAKVARVLRNADTAGEPAEVVSAVKEQIAAIDGAFAQGKLLDHPAPEVGFLWSSETDGPRSLADLKGKVVVIDFWATWCAPCVAAMPHLQSIAERYADKGVVVLGINQDTPDHRAAVDAFLEDKAITFPQILDPDDAIATRFGVSALPTTVIVDAEGIVQAWTVGYHVRADYTAQIDRVLAGETLPMPEPPARPGDTLDTIENLALTITPWPAPVTAWEGATLTTEDGTAFYMPHDMGGLAKLDHATGQLTRVAPQGVDPNRAIIAFAPVAGEHGGWLLATDDSTDYADLAFTRVDRNGTRRWSVPLGIDPAIEPTYDAGIETCDIDHDGEDEFLIAVGVSDSESWEEQVILVILDQNGRTLYTKPIALDGFGATHLVENEGEPTVLYIFGYSQLVRVSLDL
jgi:thiol-disulfide isomerase/thioredoxin